MHVCARKNCHTQKYIKSHTYGHAVTADLWRAMEAVSSEKHPIVEIMDTWTKQTGYPVLTLAEGVGRTYRLSQERFLVNNQAVAEKNRWSVYVQWMCSDEQGMNITHHGWLLKERPKNLSFQMSVLSFNISNHSPTYFI